MEALTAIPTELRPFFLPVVSIIIMLMGFAAAISFGNPGLRASVVSHIPWLIGGGILVVSGVAILTRFMPGL